MELHKKRYCQGLVSFLWSCTHLFQKKADLSAPEPEPGGSSLMVGASLPDYESGRFNAT
jgi:hypothetical protein